MKHPRRDCGAKDCGIEEEMMHWWYGERPWIQYEGRKGPLALCEKHYRAACLARDEWNKVVTETAKCAGESKVVTGRNST